MELLLRPVVAAVAVAALASACHLVPDDAADPARGVGVATALHVLSEGVRHSERAASGQPPGCRAPLAEVGPLAVTTTVTWTRKASGVPVERIGETVRWRRDAAGDVSAEHTLELRLPDGRVVHRTREDRIVAGEPFAAIDGRFVAADRVPRIRGRAAAAFAAADALLSRVAMDPSGRLVPATGNGLCRPPEGSFGLPEGSFSATSGPPEGHAPGVSRRHLDHGLPPVDDASLTLGARRRTGWLRWDDRAADIRLVVTFDERVHSFDGDIVRPETLWEVDPDRSWSRVEEFLRAGFAEGWLEPPRVADTTADPEQP